MTTDKIRQRVESALQAIHPDNTAATPKERMAAWLYLKEMLLIIYK